MQKRWFCLSTITILLQAGFAVANAATDTPLLAATDIPPIHSDSSQVQVAPKSQQQKPTPITLGTQEQSQLKAQVEASISHYESAIAGLESQSGAYGGQLEQQLMSLGLAQEYLGKHAKAIKIYKRAMHLNRINEGLYSTGQIPIIDRLINSHIALAQWDKVNDKYHYMYWLNAQNYGENDIRMLPTLNQLSRWHLQAYAMRFGDDRSDVIEHLVKAHSMFEKSIELLSNQYGQNSQYLIDDLNGLTLTNYFFATFQQLPLEQYKSTSNMISDLDMRRSNQMINQFIANSFRGGRESISRVIDIHTNNENSTPSAVAKAKVKLADWFLMFNKRNSAIELYQEVYQSLTEQDSTSPDLVEIFDHPVALPRLDLLENNTYSETDEREFDKQRDYVVASFNVTPQGKTTNVEIIESQPAENNSARSRVKKSLRLARFRPRFVAGEPVYSEPVTLRILAEKK
ncbi:MAG: tetratricopeptide (TPR) repeat protein [Alteromonadaceae bacterium]|jgi:tetratricopeptide (TPR) repeat protein